MKSKLLLLSLVATISIVLSGCGGTDNNATNTPATDKNVTAAANPETIYKQNCTNCHGNSLSKIKTSDLNTVGARLSKEEIATKIAKGGGGMIAFEKRLDTEEIDVLSQWLVEKK